MPKPEPAQLGKTHWTAPGGDQFPYTSWMPESGKPKAVFVAIHGLSGAADDFRPLGKYFRTRDVAVYAHELRGQGHDPIERRRGDIKSPNLWYNDLNRFVDLVRRQHEGVPLYLYGESMGALIAIHGLHSFSEKNLAAISGMVFASPVVAYKQRMPLVVRVIVRVMGIVIPRWKVSLEALAGNEAATAVHVTSDTTHAGQMAKTKHYISHFTLRLLRTVDRMIRSCHQASKDLTMPVFVIYSGHDALTSPEHIEEFYEALPSESKGKYFSKDSFHLILHDKDSEKVLDALHGWMQKCCD